MISRNNNCTVVLQSLITSVDIQPDVPGAHFSPNHSSLIFHAQQTCLVKFDYLISETSSEEEGKSSDKASDKKQAITASDMTMAPKTAQHMKRIRAFLSQHGTGSCHELAQELHLSEARVRAILAKMEDIEPLGPQKSRRYRLK